jgi:hypothetical protein
VGRHQRCWRRRVGWPAHPCCCRRRCSIPAGVHRKGGPVRCGRRGIPAWCHDERRPGQRAAGGRGCAAASIVAWRCRATGLVFQVRRHAAVTRVAPATWMEARPEWIVRRVRRGGRLRRTRVMGCAIHLTLAAGLTLQPMREVQQRAAHVTSTDGPSSPLHAGHFDQRAAQVAGASGSLEGGRRLNGGEQGGHLFHGERVVGVTAQGGARRRHCAAGDDVVHAGRVLERQGGQAPCHLQRARGT